MTKSNESPIIPGIYADPTVDFAFKRIFGTEKYKDAAIGLINSIIPDRKIKELEYINSELPREVKDGKTIVIDVLCRDENDNIFLVEMQKARQSTFRERMVYYASRASRLIGNFNISKGDGTYKMPATYIIAFLNFPVDQFGSLENSYCIHYRTVNPEDGSKMPGSPEYFFFDLVRFAKKLEEITDEKDFWLYSLRESRNQSTMPEVLKGRPGFDAYYEASRCAGFTKEESDSYIKDMMTEIDINISMREQRAEGFAEGLAEGLAEGEAKGKAEGKAEGRTEIARAMKAENLPLSSISKFTGLSIEEIERL